jgi:hypothetical protein
LVLVEIEPSSNGTEFGHRDTGGRME